MSSYFSLYDYTWHKPMNKGNSTPITIAQVSNDTWEDQELNKGYCIQPWKIAA